ncbi:MAG: class F sortase [Tepidiformaceae bacterium]
MKLLRILAVTSFLAGVALLAYGFVQSGDDDDAASPEPVETYDIRVTLTPSPTAVGTAEPTATPTPYGGAVARLRLPSLEVDSAIEVIGVKANNQMDVPHDPLNTGWYDVDGWGKPGYGSNSVFAAHVDYYPNILGPFNKLKDLEPGVDDVVVVMDNGLEYRYRVIRKARFPVSEIKMGELIWPDEKPEGAEWITLITCGGDFVSAQPGGPGEYLHRDVVVAERYQ